MNEIVVIAHNIRSAHNIGSIIRTCEGFGVKKVIISGYSPYPKLKNDTRLPHISEKLTKQISKASLGAEKMINIEFQEYPDFQKIKNDGYTIVGLEQDKNSCPINQFKPRGKTVLVLGEEINGIDKNIIKNCDFLIEIPMYGKKESFNVSVATGIALYQMTI